MVAAGDRVLFRPAENTDPPEGMHRAGRAAPRDASAATVRGRQHVLVANVDQLLIVASAAEPRLKPNLIDRMLVGGRRRPASGRSSASTRSIWSTRPTLQPLVGVYSQMGYQVLLAEREDRLRRRAASAAPWPAAQSVVAGQSGVGKSSLLNAIDPSLHLRVARGQRGDRKGEAHDDHRPAAALWPAAATWSTRRASASSSFGT